MHVDALLSSLINSNVSLKEHNKRMKSWGTLFGSQHFEGRGACWSSMIRIKKRDKQINYSHGPAQTKQQVG
jgi:hypothetical protein